MAKTVRYAKVNSNYITRSHYLMESQRLDTLSKAVQKAYGLILTIGQLQKLDKTIMQGIDKLLK